MFYVKLNVYFNLFFVTSTKAEIIYCVWSLSEYSDYIKYDYIIC